LRRNKMKCMKCGAEIKEGEEFCGECGAPRQGSTVQTTQKGSWMSENTKGALCYLFGWITGVIFLLVEKDSKFVKFHAVQSVIISLVLQVILYSTAPTSYYDPYYGYAYTDSTLYGIVGLIMFILWIVMMYKASKGEKFKLPVIGDFAEKQTQ